MAQTIKAYTVVSRNSIGGRYLNVVEVELGTEYLTEGFVVDPTQIGLPVGLVDAAWACSEAIPAKGATSVGVSLVVVPGPPSTLSLQLYPAGKEKLAIAEEASKGTVAKEFKVIFCVIGR